MDGVVVEGRSSIDESMITEAYSRGERSGDQVTGAALNQTGSFTVRAEAGLTLKTCWPGLCTWSQRLTVRPFNSWPTWWLP